METLSEEKIKEIYETKVKKTSEYFQKGLVKRCPVKKWRYRWNNKDAPRCFCVRDFIEWIEKYNIKNCRHLGFTSRHDPELEFINSEKSTYYPYIRDKNFEIKNDLHTFKTEEKHDFFIFNQTLEHVYNPFLVIQNIGENISQGGYVFTSVPTINIPHETPFNFFNHYPMGLAILFVSSGFEIVETGQWGNSKYLEILFRTHGWPDVYQTGENNEEKNVAQCWVLAKKL